MVDRGTFRRLNANYQFPIPAAPKVDNMPQTPNGRFTDQSFTAPSFDMYGNPVPLPIPVQNGTFNVISADRDPDQTKYRYLRSNRIPG